MAKYTRADFKDCTLLQSLGILFQIHEGQDRQRQREMLLVALAALFLAGQLAGAIL